MKRMALILGLFGMLASAGCNQAQFSNQDRKKAAVTNPDLKPPTGDANPMPPANCTAMSKDQCVDRREKDGTGTSFRNVDCKDKKFSDCEAAVTNEKNKDGNLNSEIRVQNCSDDNNGAACKDLIDKVNPNNDLNTSDGGNVSTSKDITLGSGDTISKFALDGSQAFDGIVNFCLNYETGEVTVTSGGGRFFGANVKFTVTHGDNSSEPFVLSGAGSGTVPNWRKACSADPSTPGWQAVEPTPGRTPPDMRVTKSGAQVCLYIDDGDGGRHGAVRITNFDYKLNYCD